MFKKNLKKSGANLLTLKVVIISIIFGFFAGVVGELFVEAYILPPTSTYQDIELIDDLSKKKENEIIAPSTDVSDALFSVKSSMVNIYDKKKTSSADVLNQVYLSDEFRGQGFILTSDGWLLTTQDVVGNLDAEDLVINIDQKIYPVSRLEIDSLLGLVLLKIDASDLPVVKLGKKENLKLAETVFALNFSKEIFVTRIKSLDYQDISKSSDLVLSSERYSKYILTKDNLDQIYKSSPLVNFDGEVVGIVLDEQKVLPIDYSELLIINVLRGDDYKRPFLGINYLDLTEVVGISQDDRQGLDRGALVYSLIKNSPAQKAEFKKGDIVTKVNNDEVDKKNSLTELIQEYQVGDKVSLTFFRDGEEKRVDIELGLLDR